MRIGSGQTSVKVGDHGREAGGGRWWTGVETRQDAHGLGMKGLMRVLPGEGSGWGGL